jgi:hypothetical protein
MLRDLLATSSHGPAPHEAPAGSSGLSSLVRPAVATVAQPPAVHMNLVQAMRALERGEIARPADGDLNGMVLDVELPFKPAPAPAPDWRDDPVFVEARQRAAVNHVEMRHRIAAKKGISIEAAQVWMETQKCRMILTQS